MAEEKISGWKKAYLVLRWPIVLGALGISAVLFFVGLISSLGYHGTTNLKPISKKSAEWVNFKDSFANGSDPKIGKPFRWKNSEPVEDSDWVTFDKRLVATMEYLKDGSVTKSPQCGWNSKHELLTLDVDTPTKWSIYGVPPNKPTPISTIFRGVGTRIYEADYIKCTERPKPHDDECEEAPRPIKWDKFGIPLVFDKVISPNRLYDKIHCEVKCAIDYYPYLDDSTESVPPEYKKEIIDVAGFNPSTVVDYEDIEDLSRSATVVKSVLLSYELMHIDDAGCSKRTENLGSDRQIPTSLIVQARLREILGDKWAAMTDSAEKKFPFSFQKSSMLAGLAPEPVLNVLGIHFNY